MSSKPIFSGFTFVFDGLTLKEKNEAINKVKSRGGTVSYSLGPKVTHLVVSDIFSPTPYQSDVINRHSIATVRVSYITECVQQEELLPVDEFSARTDIPSVDTSTSVSPASSTDEVPPPLDEKLDVELMAASEEGHTTAALSSPVVKKKVISGRNRNQKKIIVIQQSPVEQTDNVRVNEADAVQPVLKFVRADLESCSVLLSASLPGGKAKKLLGRLKDAAELDDLALVDTSGYLVKKVCCGSYHTALINHAGQLMTWGSGGARLGHGGNAVLKPTVVPGIENCVILACSSTQTAVLTAEGQLIALDDNNGRVQVDASHCGDVAEIYCGNGVTALRNTANAVYFVGKFMKKSYGLDCPIDGAFKSVSFGAEHCLLVTSEGTIMAFGSNGSGQLGLGDKTERVTPVVINGLTEVTAVIAGERHSAALTKTAGLYVWGASPHGFDDMLTPVKHNYQHAGTVTKLEMSKEHLIALHSTGISRWPLDSFGSNTFGDDHTEVFDESARNVSCGAQHVMVEVSSCAAIAHQLVQHGTPDMATNLVNILGNEAIRLVDENQFTLLHKAILNMDAAAVLTALLDARSDWDLNAKTDLEDTTAVLCVMFNDIQALEVLAERGAQLELALIRAGDDRNMAMIELLLEYNVDRTCFFANKNLNDMPEIIVEKVAQAGGLLGMDFAPVEDLVKFGLIPDRATPSSELLPEKYPCKIGVVRGTSDMELAHKFTTALQGYGARIIADTWSHPDYISGDTNTLVAILTKTSVKDKVFVSKLIETYKSGKHIVPVWVDEEELEVPIEAKKKLKTLFVKSGVRFNFSASEVDSNEHNHRVRNFSKQLAAFNTKALHAPRAAKVSITDFSFDEEGTTVQSRRKRPEFRVYVSTTLHDMVEERELLLTKVFPEIEKLCAERGVPFSFTDMNAGAQSDVLDYDSRLLSGFDLIDKSSCFIGLFGERYGWHAQHGGAEDFTKNLDLAAQRGHQWVSAFSNRSINELEVVHGVLKYVPGDKLGSFAESYEEDAQGEVPRDVLFYYREPSYVQKIPIKKKSQFVSESYSAKSLLSDMKYRIGLAGLPSKNYRQPSDFAAEILNDLRKVLDKQFPPTMKSVDMADVEAYKQQDLAAHLAASSVPLFKATRALLHSYINSRSRYSFTIKGAQGSGKSYLLASIAAEYQKYNPEALVVFVAVDMTNWQNDLAQKSVIHQIKSRCGDCPAQSFVEWLEHAGRTTPVLLVVDGVDNLSEFWLPEDVLLPNNVKLVASRTDGYNSFFTTQLKIDDSEFSLYLSHCFNATKRKDAKGAFEEEDIKQRVRELPLAKNLAVVRFFIEEVSRASLAADVEEVISKFKRLQTLEDVMKEIVLPNLRKEFNNIEQALQILLTSSSPQEIFQKGISFERACRLKYLLNLPM